MWLAVRLAPLAAGDGQQDLRAYHFAARTWLRSGDPYDPAEVAAVAQDGRAVPFFLYPPSTLPAFTVLARTPLPVARALFLALQLAALAVLIAAWRRIFVNEVRSTLVFVVTLLFGYDQAVVRDLAAGNVSTLEQVPLWIGLHALIRGSPIAAGIGIGISAFFKQITGLFLILLPLRAPTRGLRGALLGASLVLGPVLLAAAIDPALFAAFRARTGELWGPDPANASTLAVAWTVAEGLGWERTWGTVAYAVMALGAIVCAALLVLRRGLGGRPLLLVCIATLAYALAVPRMKDYSYILLLMPSLHAVRIALSSPVHRGLFYALLWTHLVPYQSWLTAAAVFALLAVHLWRGENVADPPDRMPEPAPGAAVRRP